MAKIQVGPVGNISKGHVLDCAAAPLVERLRDYDPQLYISWNPRKLRGHGCWEVRRKPDEKSVRENDVVVFQGNTIVFPKYHENNLVNHVLDVPYLNYLILEKLKRMDMWTHKETGFKGKKLTEVLDYKEAKFLEKEEDNALKELDYNLKQHSSEIRWFKDYVASGHNPYRLADYWGRK
jgi:hypothetical protein